MENLSEWQLETDWDVIRVKRPNEWKKLVLEAAEKKNKERLIKECYKKERGASVVKTKTKRLIPILESEEYIRKPQPYMEKTRLIARAYIMGRYGMLQCAVNFSNGYGSKICKKCKAEDDESHRINVCTEWADINLLNSSKKVDFDRIFSESQHESMQIVDLIVKMWDLGNNRNCMKSDDTR